jgi:hypothetical protein
VGTALDGATHAGGGASALIPAGYVPDTETSAQSVGARRGQGRRHWGLELGLGEEEVAHCSTHDVDGVALRRVEGGPRAPVRDPADKVRQTATEALGPILAVVTRASL